MAKIEEIIENGLEVYGFDGLYVPGVCACKLGELYPCDGVSKECLPGVFVEQGDDPDAEFYIGEREPKHMKIELDEPKENMEFFSWDSTEHQIFLVSLDKETMEVLIKVIEPGGHGYRTIGKLGGKS